MRKSVLAPALMAFAAQSVNAQPAIETNQPIDKAIIGRYEYRDSELSASLQILDDHSFEYKVDTAPTKVEGGAEVEPARHLDLHGVWRWRDISMGEIELTNAPTTPPVLRQTSAVRDPGVRAALTVISTDGKPVKGLGLLVNNGEVSRYADLRDGANGGLNMLDDGTWTMPLQDFGTETVLPEFWEIQRERDGLSLIKIALRPEGPNRFTFSYTPSPVEPFRLSAGLRKGKSGIMDVEIGAGSIPLHRVTLHGGH